MVRVRALGCMRTCIRIQGDPLGALYFYLRARKPVARGAHEAERRAIEAALTSLLNKPNDARREVGMNAADDAEAARQVAIVDTATGVFLQYGFKKTTMEDIARTVGISRQALYLDFPTKETGRDLAHPRGNANGGQCGARQRGSRYRRAPVSPELDAPKVRRIKAALTHPMGARKEPS
ncbi:hypothetical protein MPL3365_290048 [Mesorhizobium plurifarium]|uniref:HTH tetR-type domain-containing protein n=1 Tax=Mesorhizobium plurifarium TaxID=69974 RepID=A0A090GDC3_MESPL|nr:hypothetical protein MPL3365_290048 [Mesorhizobium plurifarium]